MAECKCWQSLVKMWSVGVKKRFPAFCVQELFLQCWCGCLAVAVNRPLCPGGVYIQPSYNHSCTRVNRCHVARLTGRKLSHSRAFLLYGRGKVVQFNSVTVWMNGRFNMYKLFIRQLVCVVWTQFIPWSRKILVSDWLTSVHNNHTAVHLWILFWTRYYWIE